jgi:Protein of unknown function DUF45
VLAPHDVLDYVVVHEVCHLVEHNHGPGFWKLVERRRPGYCEPKDWLHEHGWEILAYRPPHDAEAALVDSSPCNAGRRSTATER